MGQSRLEAIFYSTKLDRSYKKWVKRKAKKLGLFGQNSNHFISYLSQRVVILMISSFSSGLDTYSKYFSDGHWYVEIDTWHGRGENRQKFVKMDKNLWVFSRGKEWVILEGPLVLFGRVIFYVRITFWLLMNGDLIVSYGDILWFLDWKLIGKKIYIFSYFDMVINPDSYVSVIS